MNQRSLFEKEFLPVSVGVCQSASWRIGISCNICRSTMSVCFMKCCVFTSSVYICYIHNIYVCYYYNIVIVLVRQFLDDSILLKFNHRNQYQKQISWNMMPKAKKIFQLYTELLKHYDWFLFVTQHFIMRKCCWKLEKLVGYFSDRGIQFCTDISSIYNIRWWQVVFKFEIRIRKIRTLN